MKIKTYPEMNEKIVDILRISDAPDKLYAAQYIEDTLRAENEKLKEALREIIALDDGNSILKYYERYYQVFRLAKQALKEVTK